MVRHSRRRTTDNETRSTATDYQSPLGTAGAPVPSALRWIRRDGPCGLIGRGDLRPGAAERAWIRCRL